MTSQLLKQSRRVGLTLALTVLAASAWAQSPAPAADGHENKGKILYYRNPMGLPDTSPTPKTDTMGMDYVPVYESDVKDNVDMVRLSADRIQKLGVRTEPVQRRNLAQPIHAVGTIQIDETRQTVIAPRFDGWVEKLAVNAAGQKVRKGDALLDCYSPQLVQIENEYLVSRSILTASPKGKAQDDGPLPNGSLEKLRALGVPDDELERLQRERTINVHMKLRAPADGTVMEKPVVEGMKFSAGDVLYRIAALDNVWMIASIFEQDMSRVAVGQSVKMTINAYPGKTFEGKIGFIYPDINKDTRTARARIDLPNPDDSLRVDMYGEATIEVAEGADVLTVPVPAVLNSGERQAVLVDLGEGRFRPQSVTIGKRGGDYIEIIDGLKEGDRIVTSANFLIDSESNLRAALQGFSASGSQP